MQGIGNGLPLAAVVTTPEIAQTLAQRLHFNTYGGNPVCCAGGRAVLQAVDEDGIQANAAKVWFTLSYARASAALLSSACGLPVLLLYTVKHQALSGIKLFPQKCRYKNTADTSSCALRYRQVLPPLSSALCLATALCQAILVFLC